MQNEFETSLESAAHSREDQGKTSCELYLERRSLVLQFLHSSLSLHNLQYYQNKVEILKKSSFYLEIEPKEVVMRDQNQVVYHMDIFQLMNPCQFLRMKKVGKIQTEIQLSLLAELLEQLKQGREELSFYTETCDMVTFLSHWDLIMQRMSQLSEFLENLLSLQTPGQLYVKHQLVWPLEEDHIGAVLPAIRLSLCTKPPLIFDREESFAHKDWAKLKWFIADQEPYTERYELHVKMLPSESGTGKGYGRIQVVTSNTCIVRDLQPGTLYEFTIHRSATHTLVFQSWHDSLTLRTKPDAAEDPDSSTCVIER